MVFFASSFDDRSDAIERWLAEMETRYELVEKERYVPGPFAEQHGEGGWVELYGFVPRRNGDTNPVSRRRPRSSANRSLGVK